MELNWAPQNRWQTEEPDPVEAAPWTAQPPLAPTGASAGPAGAPPQPAGGADSDGPGPEASNEHLPLDEAGPPQSEDEQEEPEGGRRAIERRARRAIKGWHEEQFEGGHPRQGPPLTWLRRVNFRSRISILVGMAVGIAVALASLVSYVAVSHQLEGQVTLEPPGSSRALDEPERPVRTSPHTRSQWRLLRAGQRTGGLPGPHG